MNKLTSQTVERLKRVAMLDNTASRRRELGVVRRAFRSYTNDLARAAKTCQAAFAAKKTPAK
jgi:hypothetical protein